MGIRIPNFDFNKLPKLPKYGYAILASMGALFMVGVMGMCVLAALLASAQTPPTPTPLPVTPTDVPVTVTCDDPVAPDAAWQVVGQDCVLHEEKTNDGVTDTLDMSYPYSLIVEQPYTKPIILNVLNRQRDSFWREQAESLSIPGEAIPWSLRIDTATTSFSNSVTSMLFSIDSYMGGAHPAFLYETVTFDFANQTTLNLPDIFKAGVNPYTVIAPLARVDLQTRFPDLAADIAEGTEPTADNFPAWGLSSDSLILYFSPYTIGPGAFGPQQASIPLLSLADSLKPEFVPGS
jgi:hypothetical protein